MKQDSEAILEQLINERDAGKGFDAIRKELEEKDFPDTEIRKIMNAIDAHELEQLKIKNDRKYQIIAIVCGTILFIIGGSIHLYRYFLRIPYTKEDLIIPFGLMTLGYFIFRKSWSGYKSYERVD